MAKPKLVAGDIGRQITLTLTDADASFTGAASVDVVATRGTVTQTFSGTVAADGRSVSYTTQSADDFPTPGVYGLRFDASWADGRRIRSDNLAEIEVVQ